MQIMTVGEVKAHFSEVLDMVQKGEDVVISFGKKKEKIAVLVPFSHYQGKPQRKLGLLEGKASFSLGDDFSITDNDLLGEALKFPLTRGDSEGFDTKE
jgi:prevent-host-death family protein